MSAIPRILSTGTVKLSPLSHPDGQNRRRVQGQLFQLRSPEEGAFQVLNHLTGDYLRYMTKRDLSRTPTPLDPHPPFIAIPPGSQLRRQKPAGTASLSEALPQDIADVFSRASRSDGSDTYELVMPRGQPIDGLTLVSREVALSLLTSAEIFADSKITPELVSDTVELARMYPFSGKPALRVLTAEELTDLLREERLPPQLRASLQAMPPATFTETWTVLVFGLGGPNFEVLGVTKKDLAVTIQYREIPPEGGARTAVVRASAAFVTVRESDLPEGAEFRLNKFGI